MSRLCVFFQGFSYYTTECSPAVSFDVKKQFSSMSTPERSVVQSTALATSVRRFFFFFFFLSYRAPSDTTVFSLSWHWHCRSLSCTDLMTGTSIMFGDWSPRTCFCAHSACRYRVLELCILLNVQREFRLLWAQFLLVFLVLVFVSTLVAFVVLYSNCQTDVRLVSCSRVHVTGSSRLSFSVNQAFDTTGKTVQTFYSAPYTNCSFVLFIKPCHRIGATKSYNSQLSWSEVHLKKPSTDS